MSAATGAPTESRAWGARPALDGLRTVAVYLVVLFHAGASWFDGGFVGVDLFFVLSGFLVTTILLEELSSTGRLSLLRFYDRRVRRLLPAAVLLIVVVSAVSLLVLSSVQRDLFIADARAALLYFANWHFLNESRDYFGAETFDASPFLHFWSLSIEEQYYFVFPLLLWGAWRLRRVFKYAVPVVLVAIFAWSVWQQVSWAGQDVNHAYYATSTRLYQLLAGSLLALGLFHLRHRATPSPIERCAPVAGFVGVVGVFVLGTSLIDLTPSARGLWVTLFAVLAVASVAGVQRHPVQVAFSQRPLVYLGQISYGTYLWHWPVVVLLQQFMGRSLVFTLVVAVVSTLLAAASYHLFERPIRIRRIQPQWRFPVIATGLSVSVVAAFLVVPGLLASPVKPVVVAASDGPVVGPENVTGPTPEIDYVEFSNTRGGPERTCDTDTIEDCAVHTGEDGPTLWILGDSQAREIEPAFANLAEEKGFNLYISAIDGCPWPLGMSRVAAPDSRERICQNQKEQLPGLFEKADVDVTVLIQQGRDGRLFSGQLGTEVGGRAVADSEVPGLYRRTIDRTMERFGELGVRSVMFESAWLPPDDSDPLACLAARPRVEDCAVQAPTEVSTLDRIYRAEARSRPDAYDVTISPLMCPARPVCDAVLDGIPVYRDPRHYSPPILDARREQIWQLIRESGALRGLDFARRTEQ
ncbi:acyltransferase [Nocardioides rotundus]|uniref:acyltransferase family protein n=1 Tax=Nocardioides rotundus TaxID=1774216 RepID=UPI001CC10E42|nr:acyltransferase family protein [Nocardioides rotundus]UAL29588.1 acyltransferase [Nocardioides rotundus]